jgi:hypothetical protein
LTRIKNVGPFEDFNLEFQVLATKVDNMNNERLLQDYMGGLKEDIKHEIMLNVLGNVDEAMQFDHHIQAKSMATCNIAIVIDLFLIGKQHPNPLKYHIKKWAKDEKKDYVLVVIENDPRGRNAKKQNCTHWKIRKMRK